MLFSTEMKDLAKICPKAADFWAAHDMAALEIGSYDLGALYSNNVTGEAFLMTPGRFAIVFPADAHMPGVCVDAPQAVKKAVFKIKVATLAAL